MSYSEVAVSRRRPNLALAYCSARGVNVYILCAGAYEVCTVYAGVFVALLGL